MIRFPTSPPEGTAPRAWNVPTPAAQDLSNGLRVAVVRMDTLPIVQVRWAFGAGRIAQDPGRIGSGLLLQRVMRHGTERLGARQFTAALDRMGARMSGGVTIDTSVVSIGGLAQHVWPIVDLTEHVALKPGLSDLALAGEKIRSRELHRHACNRTDAIVEMMLGHGVYGAHPYGAPATTASGLAATSRADLVDLHRSIAAPQRGLVLVVGDVDPDRVLHKLAERYANIPVVETSVPVAVPAPQSPPRRLLFVEHPTAEQATVGVGGLAIPRNHPDHAALRVANQAIGGSASSRLFRRLRDDRSLTYGVYSTLDCGVHAGDITAVMGVAPDNAAAGLAALLTELHDASAEPLVDAEITSAKRILMGAFPQQASGLTGVGGLAVASWLHGLPSDEWHTIVSRIHAVPTESVNAAAATWFDPMHFTAGVCGPPSSRVGLASAVRSFGLEMECLSLAELADFIG